MNEDYFVSPWQASIEAVDLSYEVGTGGQHTSRCLTEGIKSQLRKKVHFAPTIDFFVGAEIDDSFVWWPLQLGVPHHGSSVFHPAQQPSPWSAHASVGSAAEDDDDTSLLAAHIATHQRDPVGVPQDGPLDAIIDNRQAVRDPNDPDDLFSTSSEADSPMASLSSSIPERWYSTLLFTIEGGPTAVWLDWYDYYGMHQRASQVLHLRSDDLHFMHWVETPPQDIARANTAAVIAHRRGDLPVGSLNKFTLLDVEFHSALPLESPEVVRKARLLPSAISREQLLRGLGLHPACQRACNRCLVWVNNVLIPLGTSRIQLEDGDYVRIAIPPGSPQVDHIATRLLASAYHQGMTMEEILMRHTLFRLGWHDEPIGYSHVPRYRSFADQADGDFALFLQVHAVKLPPLDVLPDLINMKICDSSDEIEPLDHAIEDLPHRTDLRNEEANHWTAPAQGLQAEPAAIQEPFMHWLASMTQLDAADAQQDPTMEITTWFLDMPTYLNCDVPRSVLLGQDFSSWMRLIATTWLDLLDPTLPISLYLVRPSPPVTSLQQHQRVHVIVLQRAPADGVANLFTVVATHQVLQPMRHFARFAPHQMAKPQVIGFASLSDQCYPELSPRQCMVWHGDLELRENLALRNRHGIAFVIIIQEMQHIIDRQNSQPQFERSAWSDDEDEASVSFIQIQASPQMRRCQTAGQVAHTQRPSPSTSKQVIHLDRLIPPPSKVVVNFEAVQTMMNELNASECAFHQEWPENLEIPTVTQEALCAPHEVTDLPPIAFHFYTDGSKTQHGAVGAGIVLLVEYPTGFAFGGALCKVVQPHGHAGVGENGAVIWALIWAVHLSNYHWRAFAQWDVHFHFHFDSVNAGYLAGGYYRTKAHKSHRILMRSMAHVLQGRHGFSRLHWLHVKAHAGNPWNELADAVARHASSFHSTHEDSEVWLAWLRDPLQLRALQWLWYLEQMNAASPYAPRIVDGFLECDIIAIPQANVPPLNCTLQTTDPVAPSPRVTIELTIATANVLTLRQSGLEQTGTSISRQQVLMQQFHDAKCTFVGIQETRHKHLVGINNELFHVIGHPADLHGNDGVQLWISKQQPLHESGPCIGKDQIRIIASSSTFLIVKINTDCWKCVIVTGRAPHSARPRQEAEAYWRTISEHLQRKASGWPLIYCGDANAHVGDCPTSAIGPLYPSQENQAGELFHQWLLQHGPYAPATFASSH